MGSCFGLFRNSTPLLDNSESDSSPSDVANFSSSQVPVFHLNPGLSIPASRLTEEEQIQIIKRMDMIQFLPSTTYVPIGKEKLKECIICMCDLKPNDSVRYLPCLHTYHQKCIDDWLMRSFVCPSCLRPIEFDALIDTNGNSIPGCVSTTHEDANAPSRHSDEVPTPSHLSHDLFAERVNQ